MDKNYFKSGLAKLNLHQYKDAIEDFSTAIQLNPKYVDAYYSRGLAKLNLHQYKDAIEDNSKAIQLNPEYVDAYLNRGNAKLNLQQYADAIEDYNRAIHLNPEHVHAYHNRGYAKSELHQDEDAIKDFSRAIYLNPKHVHSYYSRGLAKSHLYQCEDAIEDYSKVIHLDPEHVHAYYNRGVAKGELQQYEDAIEDYSKVIHLDPNHAQAYYNRGNDKLFLDLYKDAIKDFSTAIHLNPKYVRAYVNRGVAKLHLHQYEDAIEDSSTAIYLDPEVVDAYLNRGNAKLCLHQDENAIEDYSMAIHLNPEYGDAYHNRGNAKSNLRQYENAIEDFSTAIHLDPEHLLAYYNRGRVFQIIQYKYQALLDFNRFLFLTDQKEFLKSLSKVLLFYKTFPAPFLLERVLRSFVDYEHIQSIDGTIDQIKQQCQPMRGFLDLLALQRAATENLMSYHHAQALICFYMGDPIAAFRIYDEKIDNPDIMGIPMNLMGHYYFIESARLFREPYENLLNFARQVIEETKNELITLRAWREIYYAGMILYSAERIEETDKNLTRKEEEEKQARITKNIREAHKYFTLAADYLPAAYMQVLTLAYLEMDSSTQVAAIRNREAKMPPSKGFMHGFPTRYFQMDDPDYFSPLLHYAHYKEILEAVNEVRSPSQPFEHNELWTAFRWSTEDLKQIEWLVRREELSQISRRLLQQFQSTVETAFQFKQPSEEIALLERAFTQQLRNDKWADTDYSSFEDLRTKIGGFPNAAQQIGFLISNSRHLSANSKMLLVEYFYLRGDLRIEDVFAMYFYIGTHQKGTGQNKVTDEAFVDMGKKMIELILAPISLAGNILTAGAAAALMRLLKNYFSEEEQIDLNKFRNQASGPLHSDYDAFVEGFLRFLSFQRESLGEKKFQQRFPLEGFEDWSTKRPRR